MAGSKQRLQEQCQRLYRELSVGLPTQWCGKFRRYAALASRLGARAVADAQADAEQTADPPPGGEEEGGGAPPGGFSVKKEPTEP